MKFFIHTENGFSIYPQRTIKRPMIIDTLNIPVLSHNSIGKGRLCYQVADFTRVKQ